MESYDAFNFQQTFPLEGRFEKVDVQTQIVTKEVHRRITKFFDTRMRRHRFLNLYIVTFDLSNLSCSN